MVLNKYECAGIDKLVETVSQFNDLTTATNNAAFVEKRILPVIKNLDYQELLTAEQLFHTFFCLNDEGRDALTKVLTAFNNTYTDLDQKKNLKEILAD